MKFRPSRKNSIRKANITIDKFNGGSNSLVDEARLAPHFAKESTNLMQVSDGLWKTRWGTRYYGAEFPANPDGAAEYVTESGETELIVIANGTAYKSTDGGTITAITGATFTVGTQCYFKQMGGYNSSGVFKNYLYIMNGVDPLARYNGSTIETYSGISAPTGLTASLVASGLSSGSYTLYGQVTGLNDVGETVGSTEVSITVNKKRDTWVAATDKGVYWGWSALAGATRYQFYLSEESGDEALLTSTTATSFVDDGSIQINPYVEPPLQNTTAAPKFKSACTSNNRIFATNDDNSRYTVYFSGTGRYIGNFSDFYGGGWINLERGGRETPQAVIHYQSGQGQGRATVLCKTPDGQGAVWQIDISSATVGDTTFSVPSAQKVIGSFGTESILGTVVTTNDAGFPNRRGFFFLGPEKQYYGLLRTREGTSNIRPYWRSLIPDKIAGIASYFYDAKILISVPTSSEGNDKTIIYDTERGNWTVDWSIGAKQFFEYTDTAKKSHLIYIPTNGTKLIEISENVLNDLGTAFNQSYISPLLPVSSDETDVLSHIDTTVKLGNPRGVVKFEILGIGKDQSFSTIGTKTISSIGSNTGVGSDFPSSFIPSTTNANSHKPSSSWEIYLTDSPRTFTQASVKKTIRKRAQLYAIQYHVYANSADTDFTLLKIQTKGRLIARKPPSSWAN